MAEKEKTFKLFLEDEAVVKITANPKTGYPADPGGEITIEVSA